MAAGAPGSASNEPQVQSSFPLPPMMYFKKYTNEAVMQDVAPKPPQLPTDSYSMFGQTCHQDDLIIRPLELQGLKRLHPQIYDRRKELKKLTASILCNFLDLLDILVKATGSQARDEKIEDLNLLFIHIHHLINEFRPHQARETLKVMMEMQQAQILDVGERLWKHIEKAGKILNRCSTQLNTMQRNTGSGAEALDLVRVKQEPLTSDLPPGAVGGSVMSNMTMSLPDMQMEVDGVGIVKDVFEKDRILTGLIDEIED